MVSNMNGWNMEFSSYFEVARRFGLLVGDVIEDSKREKARIHVLDGKEFFFEYNGKKREVATSWKVICKRWGIYDGKYEGIEGIKVTQGNPQQSKKKNSVVWITQGNPQTPTKKRARLLV